MQLKCNSDILCVEQCMSSTIHDMQRYNVSLSDLCSRQHLYIRSTVSEELLRRTEGTNIKTSAMEMQQFVRFFIIVVLEVSLSNAICTWVFMRRAPYFLHCFNPTSVFSTYFQRRFPM